jgi:predicted HAD superfamily hydrolase
MLSLDVFDTTLTRLMGDPATLFLLLGRKLMQENVLTHSAEAFARARLAAERRCRENLLHEDVTLEEIYVELGGALRLSEVQRQRIMKEELYLEQHLLRPVPRTVDLLQEARNRGLSVSFVSDTYFPLEFVRNCLGNHGFYREGDWLLTSSRNRHTKGSGSLFRDQLSATALPGKKIYHRGNNYYADVKAPRALGLMSSHFSEGNLNRHEIIWESFRWETEGLSSLLAGASRLTRLSVPARSPKERVLRDIAAGVAAPTLVGYVLWVLQEAQRRKLRRLYFLSREGEILLAIARSLADRVELDCDLLYLYGSRQAWHLPSVASIEDPIHDWLFIAHNDFSIARVLRRICLTPQDVKPALERLGFNDDDWWARNLSGEQRGRLQIIVADPLFQSALLAAAATKRPAAVEYFRQAGLMDSAPWAIVDVGWAGMIQRSLARILAMAGGASTPVGFYYGLVDGGTDPKSGIFQPYMFDHRSRTGFGPWNGVVAWPLIDIFCEGTEGQVLEYAMHADGQVEPVLKEQFNDAAVKWGLPIVRTTILRFAEILCLDPLLTNPTADLRGATAAVLQNFWNSPTPDEAHVWGAFPYEVEQGGGPIRTLGQAYSMKDLGRIMRSGSLRHHVASWRAGSLAASPKALQVTLRLARDARRRTRTIVGRLRRSI